MDRLIIEGGQALHGEVRVAGAKNSVLPVLAASILADGPLLVQNVPHLKDVTTMVELLGRLGAKVSLEESNNIRIDPTSINSPRAPYDLVKTMRAAVVVLGPLLAKFGEAEVSLPGGCAIGSRPVDIHLKGLKAMGAEVLIENGYIHAKAPNGLSGASIICDSVTVTGTENLMMAATLAKGVTVIKNAAREPEVVDLAHCLIKMGAKISGVGTATLTIEGVNKLHSAAHKVIPDRVVAGTYLCAAAVTRGKIKVKDVVHDDIAVIVSKLKETGCNITMDSNSVTLDATNTRLQAVDINTSPHPGFPTDMQAQLMVVNCLAQGSSTIIETIFENRFMHVPELKRMGALIKLEGHTAICTGVEQLQGAQVMATDLRASASLVLAAMAAQGETVIERIYHVDRGYECIEETFNMLGATIKREN
jgi:UDP-N-acetylglucosamine 1-carboxyvinyltransferase